MNRMNESNRQIPNSDGTSTVKMDRNNRYWLVLYVIVQLLILIAIEWSEQVNPYTITGKIMYSVIVMNFLAALICLIVRIRSGWSGRYFIFVGLTFTLAADYFLTLTDSHYAIGVILFCIVQTVYAVGLGISKKNALFRIILLALYTAGLLKLLGLDTASSLVEGYSIAMLTANIVIAFMRYSSDRQKTMLMLAVGLLLFAGCDLCVGLKNALWYTPGLENMCSIMYFMIWIFYLPAQLLITLSWILKGDVK